MTGSPVRREREWMHRSFDAGSIALGGLTALAWVALEDDPGSGYTGCISQCRARQPERQCCEGLRCNDAVNDFRREKPVRYPIAEARGLGSHSEQAWT